MQGTAERSAATSPPAGGAPPPGVPVEPHAPPATARRVFTLTLRVWWRNLFRFGATSIAVLLPLGAVVLLAARLAGDGGGLAVRLATLAFPLALLQGAAVTHGALEHLACRPVGVAAMLVAGARRAQPLAVPGAILAVLLVLGGGFVGLAALLAIAVLGVAMPPIVAEVRRPADALRRCAQLTRGSWPSVLGAAAGIALVFGLAQLVTQRLLAQVAADMPVVRLAVSSAVAYFVWPLPLVFPAVAYHTLRVAKEGPPLDDLLRTFA